MLGSVVKNKQIGHSIVVDRDMAALISDEKINQLLPTKGLQIKGIVMAGDFENEQDKTVAMQ